ncbi:hypothetical protein A4X09_0g2140 [Tilletia walkeri]|uniref:Uncharacterized protein n=1 Tax=Tilletia walkeri TaxID=117179 RepID=A0A8X7NAB7_9BASI|nr:hypothetical protein A4X09_0g2140 [Tilletia walkeri]
MSSCMQEEGGAGQGDVKNVMSQRYCHLLELRKVVGHHGSQTVPEFPTLSLHERLLVTGGTDGSFTFHTYPSSKPAWESPPVAFGTGSTEYLRRRTRDQQYLLRLRTAHPPLGPEDRRLPPLACTLLSLRLKSGSYQHHLHRPGLQKRKEQTTSEDTNQR